MVFKLNPLMISLELMEIFKKVTQFYLLFFEMLRHTTFQLELDECMQNISSWIY